MSKQSVDVNDFLAERRLALKRRVARGYIITIEDVFKGLPIDALPFDFLYCMDVSPGSVIVRRTELDANPSLSFSIRHGIFRRYHRSKSLIRELRDSGIIQSDREANTAAATTLTRHHFRFFFLPQGANNNLVRQLASCLKLVRDASLNRSNQDRDRKTLAGQQLEAEIRRYKDHFGLPEFRNFLAERSQLPCALIHVTAGPIVNIDIEHSDSAAVEALSALLKKDARDFSATKDNPHFVDFSIRETEAHTLLLDCATWGKPLIARLTADIESTTILLVPITAPYIRTDANREGWLAPDVILLSCPAFTHDKANEIVDYVEAFAFHRFHTMKFRILERLHNSLRTLQSSWTSYTPLSASEILSQFKVFVLPYLHEILYTTNAHSVSLRLYDLASGGMRSFAEAHSYEGGYIEDRDKEVIPLRFHSQSVVAFAFLHGGERFPYVYVPRTRPGIGGHGSRSYIPDEYKRAGLYSLMKLRNETRSEICFALMSGTTPFATLNIEAPIPYAFDRDIDFLKMLKEAFESYYQTLTTRTDLRWLTQQVNRSDAIHELRQFQEAHYFTPEQNAKLKELFPEYHPSKERSSVEMTSLQTAINSWISSRYSILSEDEVDTIISIVKIDHLAKRDVDPIFFRSVLTIVRNLIQNIIKHGNDQSDLVIIDDRAWFGVSHRDTLRIYYKSAGIIDQLTLDSLCLKPPTDASGAPRYGMFLVGTLTRLLGGSVHVARSLDAPTVSLNIHLPYPKVER